MTSYENLTITLWWQTSTSPTDEKWRTLGCKVMTPLMIPSDVNIQCWSSWHFRRCASHAVCWDFSQSPEFLDWIQFENFFLYSWSRVEQRQEQVSKCRGIARSFPSLPLQPSPAAIRSSYRAFWNLAFSIPIVISSAEGGFLIAARPLRISGRRTFSA